MRFQLHAGTTCYFAFCLWKKAITYFSSEFNLNMMFKYRGYVIGVTFTPMLKHVQAQISDSNAVELEFYFGPQRGYVWGLFKWKGTKRSKNQTGWNLQIPAWDNRWSAHARDALTWRRKEPASCDSVQLKRQCVWGNNGVHIEKIDEWGAAKRYQIYDWGRGYIRQYSSEDRGRVQQISEKVGCPVSWSRDSLSDRDQAKKTR